MTVLVMLSLLSASVTAETSWAYVPDQPALHFVNWELNTIPVYVNDPEILGAPLLIILFSRQRWLQGSLSIDFQLLHN